MIGRRAAQAALFVLCLCPQMGLAQDEGEAASAEPAAEEAKPSTIKSDAAELKAKAEAFQDKAHGVLGDFRVGPHVAVGIPHPMTVGLDVVYADLVSLSFGSGRFGHKFDTTEIELTNWDLTARWYVFRGSFYLGAAYGHQTIIGKGTKDVTFDYNGVELTVPSTIRLEIESNYLTPQLGWFARWDWGLTLGFELGLQMPSGAKSELQTSFSNVSTAAEETVRNSADYKKNKKDVEDLGKTLGEKPIPYITLLKVGFLF